MAPRVRALAWRVALVLVLSFTSRVAEAAVLRIEWPTVPGCPGAAVVLARARLAIAHSKDADDVRAVAEITPPLAPGGSWRLHIRTRTMRGAGERTLDAPSCDAVARTAALLVAIASLRTEVPSTDSEPRSIDEIVPAPDRVEEPGARAPPLALDGTKSERGASAKDDETHFVPSVGVGLAIGLLPRAAPSANAAFGYESGWLRARIEVRTVLPQDEVDGASGAEFTTFGASLDVCARLPLRLPLRVKTFGCAGAAVDDVHANGIGGTESFDVRRTAMLAFGGLGVAFDVARHLRVGADARVGGSLARPIFVIDSVTEGERVLHRPFAVRVETSLVFGYVF